MTRRLRIIDGFAATLPAPAVERLRQTPGVWTVTTDASLGPQGGKHGWDDEKDGDEHATALDTAADLGSLQNAAKMIGADDLWTAGITGRGVDVALTYAVDVAWRKGIVVAAGNRGPEATRLDNPAYDPRVLAVGASDPAATAGTKDDLVASFSSRGNAVRGADLVAPGRSIVGLRNPGSNVDLEHPLSVVADRFARGSGTSQAAAVTLRGGGLAAPEAPALTPDQVKALLRNTTKDLAKADRWAGARGCSTFRRRPARPRPAPPPRPSPSRPRPAWAPWRGPRLGPPTRRRHRPGGRAGHLRQPRGRPHVVGPDVVLGALQLGAGAGHPAKGASSPRGEASGLGLRPGVNRRSAKTSSTGCP